MSAQVERAFQKQDAVFIGRKRLPNKKSSGPKRYYKSIGLGFKTPKEAITGTYVDKKCPFTGNVSIRGRILKGKIHKAKMKNTVIVRRNYLHFITKYQRFEKRHKNVAAHCSPAFRVQEGDEVTIGECRPLSKTVRFNVIRLDKSVGGEGTSGVKLFNKY